MFLRAETGGEASGAMSEDLNKLKGFRKAMIRSADIWVFVCV